ncbi:protein kinase domain-containing protein [Streptomyces boninensis]|uniref:protein kinase domain-containing protein n=1 Tax=Streptomyces boninensis TaxID=2039455 RepID=UPI003B213E73
MRDRVLDGRYRLLERIGSGGMGTVWRAKDERLARYVAVKLLRPAPDASPAGEPEAVERFRREARAAAALNSPYIVPVHDLGMTDLDGAPVPYLVMQLVDGGTLAGVQRETGPLPVDRAARIGTQICRALQASHAAMVVHRDIKPANIMVGPDDAVKVMDFGIAKFIEEVTAAGYVTATGAAPFGTPLYMAPERFRSEPVEGRTDMYSVGCVLYELLTGRPPFHSDSGPALIYQHQHDPPASPRELRPGVPEELAVLVLRMLAKTPQERPTAAEAVTQLVRYAQPGQPAPEGRIPLPQDAQGPPSQANHQAHSGHPAQSGHPGLPPVPPSFGPAPTTTPAGSSGRRGRVVGAWIAAGVAAAVLVTAALIVDPFGDEESAAGGRDEYVIAVEGDFNGEGKKDAVTVANSVKMAVDDINRKDKLPVQLKVRRVDDFGSKGGATQVAEKLVKDDDVIAVVGPATAPDEGMMTKASQLYAEHDLLLLSTWVRLTGDLGSSTFQTMGNPGSYSDQLVRYLNRLSDRRGGPQDIAFVSDEQDFNIERAQELLESGTGYYAGAFSFNTDTELRDVVQQLRSEGYDAVHFTGPDEEFARLDKQLAASRFSGIRITDRDYLGDDYKVKAPWLVVREYCDWLDSFDPLYERQFKGKAVLGGIESYDSGAVVAEAVRKTKDAADTEAARRTVTKSFDTLKHKGLCNKDMRYGRDGFLVNPAMFADVYEKGADEGEELGDLDGTDAREVDFGTLK